MSVVSSSKIIFCEGKQSSLDAQLLERVLETLPTERPTIVSSVSKFTFSVFAQGYFFLKRLGIKDISFSETATLMPSLQKRCD
ncbi:hypothetical protein [Argonema antarcticum]|uniref:hypothetical protein n=1 Tax=Argonema antarcticum TaxID=2942763 RepID=UPI002011B032|nr:hypothetical protein [Argonema antarcticum]MCL1475995.1 hypothetical protein [Argonema antarcticum A004/B2]